VSESWGILRHRHFRGFFFSYVASHACTMMQETALLWHVSLLAAPEERGLALGTVALAKLLPLLGLSLVGGVVADSVDRRKLVFYSQVGMMLVAAALAWVTWTGVFLSLFALYLGSGLKAAAGAFDLPARQALLPSLVLPEELPAAVNLMALGQKSAVIVGPALSGVVITLGGIACVYGLNALSFVGVLVTLVGLPPGSIKEGRAKQKSAFLTGGIRFLFADPLLRAMTLLDFSAMLFGSAGVLLPLIAQEVLGVGAGGYGWLRAAIPAGAWLAGIGVLRWSKKIKRQGLAILGAVMVYSIATICFGFSTNFWLSLFCLALVGGADMVSTTLRSVLCQERTPDEMRGRVGSINSLFSKGGPQLGQLEAGLAAQALGAQGSVVSGGLGAFLVTVMIAAGNTALRSYQKDPQEKRSIKVLA
jgi:MFS family permease